MTTARPPELGGTAESLLRRRWSGAYRVDPWGLDDDAARIAERVVGLRWSVSVDGAEHVPVAGPALVVANRRIGVSEPGVVALGLRRATGRVPRLAVVRDWPCLNSVLRRLGAVLAEPAEVAGLLRAGEMVVVFADRSVRFGDRAGKVLASMVEPAVRYGSPVVPAAVLGHELGWRWRVVCGEAIVNHRPAGPLAVADLADAVRACVQDLLDR